MADPSLRRVPRVFTVVLFIAVAGQFFCGGLRGILTQTVEKLPEPPSRNTARLLGLGDHIGAARSMMLRLQTFDNQPGVSLSFKQLDYARVTSWLERILELDPRSQSPLMAATRVYAAVDEAQKKRRMLAFTERQFLKAPSWRWPAMAQAIYVAKHQLHDLPLALRYARVLAQQQSLYKDIPPWTATIAFYVLEELGEIGQAALLLDELLRKGVIDAHEFLSMRQRLPAIQEYGDKRGLP